ncbi:hypothetical protein [uncultured Robinsoniella sp.]|uniref:hypothetical protein n=1 Tax=uncultured Robinsoniella sp. TaxID=904190 RepID=UPI00374ED56C
MRKIFIKGTIIAALGALSITMAACGSKPESNGSNSVTESSAVTRESGSRQKETPAISKQGSRQSNEMQTKGKQSEDMQTKGKQSEDMQTKGKQSTEMQTGKSQKNEMQDESQAGGMSESKDGGQVEMQTDSGTGNAQSSELTK